MEVFNLASRSVVYVMDAYCGWCWGFSNRMGEFTTENQHRIAFTAISGGLFIDERARPIASYPHIPEANARITEMTGAVFSERYNSLLDSGHLVMNSLDAGAALAVLRRQAPERAVHWAHELQAAFYGSGLSLSDPTTIAGIASANGLDEEAVLRDLASGAGAEQAQADFELSRRLGVTSYPTLLFIDGNTVHPLPATGTPLNVLNRELDKLLG